MPEPTQRSNHLVGEVGIGGSGLGWATQAGRFRAGSADKPAMIVDAHYENGKILEVMSTGWNPAARSFLLFKHWCAGPALWLLSRAAKAAHNGNNGDDHQQSISVTHETGLCPPVRI